MKLAFALVVLVILLLWLRVSLVGWSRRDFKGGWRRIGRGGPGVTWCLKTEPLLFSQRQGRTRYLHLGRWRWRYLPRERT